MADTKRIVIAGGSGFLGSALTQHLLDHNYEIVVLTRNPRNTDPRFRQVAWDGKTAGDWQWYLEGAAAVINLCGRSVHCLPTVENQKEILESRLDSVKALVKAMQQCVTPPPVWVQAGSLAIYGDTGDAALDESAPEANGFSADVCKQWEAALMTANLPRTRKVILRIGIILGPDGGALEVLSGLARWFLGGAAGSGKQYISWMHVDDFNDVVRWCLERPQMKGAFNACGPTPVTNAEFMRSLRRALDRPWCPPAPAFAVRLFSHLLLRTDAELALSGRRCRPAKLRRLGFRFQYTRLDWALSQILRPEFSAFSLKR